MNIIAKLRSTLTKNRRRDVLVAGAAALVVAAVALPATAFTPTIDVPFTYKSIVEISLTITGPAEVYSVTSGNRIILTDLVLANPSTTSAIYVSVYHGHPDCVTVTVSKIKAVIIPPQNTVDLSLATGLYFGPGQRVCIGTGGSAFVSARGYHF